MIFGAWSVLQSVNVELEEIPEELPGMLVLYWPKDWDAPALLRVVRDDAGNVIEHVERGRKPIVALPVDALFLVLELAPGVVSEQIRLIK